MWKDFQYVKFNFSMLAIKLLKKMTHFYAIFLYCFFVFLKLSCWPLFTFFVWRRSPLVVQGRKNIKRFQILVHNC